MNQTQFDALVVGGGAAGLYTALCLSEHLADSSRRPWQVALVAKDDLALSASGWAQGGIAAVVGADDSPDLHAEDTLRAGAGLCELEAVGVLVNEAKPQIEKLLELGVDFDRHGDALALTLEAAHSRRRVLHAADATGRALVSELARKVLEKPNICVMAATLVLDLYLEGDRCAGVFCVNQTDTDQGSQLEQPDRQVACLRAPIVVLATGGGAQVFAQTTNPESSTGDGVAIAWRAGAKIRDMEFVQFHPTALAVPGAPRFLISEAVRGEGAHLIDVRGDRFTFNYDPRGELAPRDVVSRAVYMHLRDTGEPTVFLDLKPIPPEQIAYRFPNIIKICQRWQIDIFSTPIPVTPAAHYCMGGVATDIWGATSIPGLYAVGETASTGVHGANRLASNSLLECFVFGARLAESVYSQSPPQQPHQQPLTAQSTSTTSTTEEPIYRWQLQTPESQSNQQTIKMIKSSLRELVWQAVGICRDRQVMTEALVQIQSWQQELAAQRNITRLGVETANLADFAYMLVRSALFRTESRGAHYRLDFPTPDPEWQAHTVVQKTQIYRHRLGRG